MNEKPLGADAAAVVTTEPVVSDAAPHVAPQLPAAVQHVIDLVTEQRRALVEIEKRQWGIFP